MIGTAAECTNVVSIEEAGVKRTLWNMFSSAQMSGGIEDVAPDCEVPQHCHEHSDEAFYVISGTGRFHVGSDDCAGTAVSAGAMVHVSAGVVHRIVNTSSTQVLRFTFTLAPAQTTAQFVAK